MARLAVFLVLAAPLLALGGQIGYAQATGYYKKETRPTLYQPLNLLDGREITAWCSPTPDPLNDQLTFGFKGPTHIDEIRVYTGNGFDESTWKELSRAKKFSIKGPAGALSFTVADQRGLQAVAVNPPLAGSQFTVEVLDLYPAEDPDVPVCITDIVFFSEGKALNGNWLTPKLKYDKRQAPYLGTWFAGYEGAPDRYLSFYFDGTYRYVYDPFDKAANKPKVLSGSYDVSGSRLVLEVPGKGKVSARAHRDKAKERERGHTLTLEGDLPEDLKQAFRDYL
ncbi:MAG: NADase-type glycan-binding domain-containing protein [Myxococcota bacterium]